jgi:tRNA U34 2-thiouridine synthase MnmA/TrmU
MCEHNKSYKLIIGQIWRIELLYSPTGEYNKTEIFKMAASRSVEVTDKEITEIKINSVPKNTKEWCKNTKTIIRLRLGDYRGIFTSTSSRRIFPDNHLAFGE